MKTLRPPPPPSFPSSGFTLLEILVAMGLFTILGLGVVLLMSTGVDLFLRGTEGSHIEDQMEQSLPRLEGDVRQILVPQQVDRIPFDVKNPDPEEEPDALPPTNRFLAGEMRYRVGDRDVVAPYVAFVREITGLNEIEMYADRAGSNARATAYIDGKDDEQEFKERAHLPTGGECEVLYIWLPDETRPGIGAVHRAYRSPIGGPGTLLDRRNFDMLEKVFRDTHPQPVFQNVTLFDLYFWTQWTTKWEWTKEEPVIVGPPLDMKEVERGARACGPSRTWDSTRGVMDTNEFHLSKGPASLKMSADDIWPRAVRIDYSVVESETQLSRTIGAADSQFTVVIGDFATGRGEIAGQMMKIGTEWVMINSRDPSRRDTFLCTRGRYGTAAVTHAAGEPVYFGRIFNFTIPIPCFRDDNN